MNFLIIKRSILIEYLIYFHIILITIQLAIRDLIIDTTFLRDIVLIVILVLWAFRKKKSTIFRNQKKMAFESWMKYLIVYGIVVSLIQIISGIAFLYVILQFRNYFLPLTFFFVSKSIFQTRKERTNLVNFLYFLFIVFLIDVLLESMAFTLGFSKYIFPWYSYQFVHSYRFITSPDAALGAIYPEDSPILGILGWTHATSATFFALFSFLIVFFLDSKNKAYASYNLNSSNLSIWKVILIFILSLAVLIILGVKTQMVSLFILILVLFYLMPKKNILKIVPIFIFLGIILVMTQQFWLDKFVMKYYIGFVGIDGNSSTFSEIFNWNTLSSFFSSVLSLSPVFVFFGGFDFTKFWFLQTLEIRLIFFTLQFGLFWFILFIGLFSSTLHTCLKLVRLKELNNFDKLFAFGTLLLIISYFIDSLHYTRVMYWPNIDIFAIILGALSNIRIDNNTIIEESTI